MINTNNPITSATAITKNLKTFITLSLLCLATSLAAQTSTWTGLGSSGNWSDGGNWSGGTPTSTTTNLIFSGATGLTNINDISGLTNLVRITFTNAGWNISGNSLAMANSTSITNGFVDNGSSPGGTNIWGINTTFSGEGGRVIITNNYDTLIFSGVLSGSGGITKYGTNGALILTGANTYSGGTSNTAGAGPIQLGNGGATGSAGSGSITLARGGANLYGTNTALAVNETGSPVFANALVLAGGNQAVYVNAGQSAIFTNSISGSGALYPNGPGTLVISNTGASYALGGCSMAGGVLQVDDLTNVASKSVFFVGGTGAIGGGGTLIWAGPSINITSANGHPLFCNGTAFQGGTCVVNIANPATIFNTFQPVGNSKASGTFVKDGLGTLTFSAVCVYTNSTVIANGTLALGVGGSIANSTGLSIAAGATFDVSALAGYTVPAAALTFKASGSGLTPSTAAVIKGSGTFTLGSPASLTIAPTSTADATHPALLVTNCTLALNNNPFIITNNSGSPLAAGIYRLIQVGDGVSGSISGTPSAGSTNVYLPNGTSGLVSGTTAAITVNSGNVVLTVTVPTLATTTALLSSANPSTYGQSVTFTAVVKTNGVTARNATSNYVFYVDGVAVATNAVVNGTNTCATGVLTAGSHTIQAIYMGDANYSSSTNSLSQTVNQAASVINTAPTASAISYRQTLASSILSGGLATPPGGSFAFTSPSTVPSVGTASYGVTYTPPDTTDYANASTTVSVTMNPAITSSNAYLTSLVFSPSVGFAPALASNVLTGYNETNAYGAPPTVTVTNADIAATDTLIVNGVSFLLNNGFASAPLTLGVGPTNVVAVRVVSQDLSVTNLYVVNMMISQATSANALSSSANPSAYRVGVTFTNTLNGDATGYVLFSTASGLLSSNNLGGGAAISLATTNLPVGTNVITAVYSGDSNYLGGSNTLNQIVVANVQAPPPPNGFKAPLYWDVYEYCYSTNNYIPESVWSSNIDWVEANLKAYGYKMICIDGWIDDSTYNTNGYLTKASTTWTHDYAWWSANLQSRGMTLGIYMDPLWIHGPAAAAGLKVKGTSILISSLQLSSNHGFVDVTKPGAQEYVNGYVQYYADMGVKYLRVDFLSYYQCGNFDRNVNGSGGSRISDANYMTGIRWIKEACAANGMLFSMVMPNLDEEAAMERQYGDMIRIDSDCFSGKWQIFNTKTPGIRYQTWSQWSAPFDGYTYWSYIGGRGKVILDGDFIRLDTFASDTERQTVISLHLMAGGPLSVADEYNTIGTSLPLYQNTEMLALNQDGFVGKPLTNDPNQVASQVWTGQMSDGSWVVGLFNRADTNATRGIDFPTQLGIAGGTVRDLWLHSDLGTMSAYSASIPPHGCTVLKIVPSSPQVIAPSFNPGAGTYGAWIYASAQRVTISTTTAGASIRYTTDGSTPTPTTGTLYSGPVTVSTNTTLQAIAYESGYGNSVVSSAAYVIAFNLQAEELSPVGAGATASMLSNSLASSAYYTSLAATGTGNAVDFTTPVIPAGTNYALQMRYLIGTGCGQCSLQIDGVSIGGMIDQYGIVPTVTNYFGQTYKPVFTNVTVGAVNFATSGTHDIKLTVTGKNASSTGYGITSDLFVFVPQTSSAPPAAPTGLACTAVFGSQINLSWTGSSGATLYNVKRATVNSGLYATIATGVNATNFEDTGLAASTEYYYVVSAINLGGEGPDSAQGTATTLNAVQVPVQPSLKAAFTNNQFGFWINGDAGQNYTIQVSTNLIDWLSITTSSISSTPYLWADTNADRFTSRFYRAVILP